MTVAARQLPEPMATLLIGELQTRLKALASAIDGDQLARCAHERARIEALLVALQTERGATDGADDQKASLFRAVGRMVVLAVAHGDGDRCRKAIELLATVGDRERDRQSIVISTQLMHRVG